MTLKNNISCVADMNVFGSSQAGEAKKTLTKLEDLIKKIQNDVALQKLEIDVIKSNIQNLQEYKKSVENNLSSSEQRISDLFNNYAEVSTAISLIRYDFSHLEKTK